MGVIQDITGLVNALRGISTFSPPPIPGPQLSDEAVRSARKAMGGSLEPIPDIRLRWYPPDIERAQNEARTGNLLMIGQLCESMMLDGVIRGLLDARTSVVCMPKRFRSPIKEITDTLESKISSDRSVYNEMVPATEARLMVADGIKAGVAIGEMVPVVGRSFPVLVRRYPQNLFYMRTWNQWYYRSFAGLLPINPGEPDADGNCWVLHIPGGRLSPWNSGLWNTLGRSYINKMQTEFARQAYEFRHSQPGRFMTAAMGATQEERDGAFRFLIRWALNAASVLPPGWDVKLVESNGQGIKVYEASIANENMKIATALCGSAVMLQGTVGFSNVDVFRVVQKDLIETTADAWDHTVNTQILPCFVGQRWGVEALRDATTVETDSTAPKDQAAETTSMTSLATALKTLVESVALAQRAAEVREPVAIDVLELLARFGIPTVRVTEIATVTGGSDSPAPTDPGTSPPEVDPPPSPEPPDDDDEPPDSEREAA